MLSLLLRRRPLEMTGVNAALLAFCFLMTMMSTATTNHRNGVVHSFSMLTMTVHHHPRRRSSPPPPPVSPNTSMPTTITNPTTRRDWFQTAAAMVAAGATTTSLLLPAGGAAWAAPAARGGGGITDADKERLKLGYQQITYLLDNFEQETTTCRANGGECQRDADRIRRVLGLRSTTDPLFQIEKVFAKVKDDDSGSIDLDMLDDLYAATEDWTSAINMSNSMAFISQFGEYNPGGGKDEVLKYLLESQKQVMLARDALKTICTVLRIDL
jgi:hypothetical protein